MLSLIKLRRHNMSQLRKHKKQIIKAYEQDLEPIAKIAKRYGVTRQGLWKFLKRWCSIVRDRRIEVKCHWCGKLSERVPCRIRNRAYYYCDRECYMAYLRDLGQPYNGNRHGMRIARTVVSQWFDLQPRHIVHHEDKNTLNNLRENLKVFKNQGDHIRYHRLGIDYAKPIWGGSKLSDVRQKD